MTTINKPAINATKVSMVNDLTDITMMNDEANMPANNMGIYIHVPFCLRKCPYCGFYSLPLNAFKEGFTEGAYLKNTGQTTEEIQFRNEGQTSAENSDNHKSTSGVIRVYKESLLSEISSLGKDYSNGRIVDTVFFGGGTPSVLNPTDLLEILTKVKEIFSVKDDAEVTLEANPGTELSVEKLKLLREGGFNRISIGIQSFDDEVLKRLGRIHDSAQAESAAKNAEKAGFDNINIDLMFGIPGQTLEIWNDTLDKAISLNPKHISFYSLQLEEGTKYYQDFALGLFEELPDDLDREMYHRAIGKLRASGYSHYEISNACLPGYECKHNLKYWTMEEYLGFGPKASSFIEGNRFSLSKDLGDRSFDELYENTEFDNMSEFVFTGLRLTSGIRYDAFKKMYGKELKEAFSERWSELDPYFASGDLEETLDEEGIPMGLRLTEKGIDISNKIMAVFV